MKKQWLAGVAVASGLLHTGISVAAEVSWLAPPGCADPRGTVEEAERLLGRPISSVNSLDFEVRITDVDGNWRLKLVTVERATGERRERELAAASCDELTASAAVALAMVVSTTEPVAPTTPAPNDSETAPNDPELALPGRPPSASRRVPPTPAAAPAAEPRTFSALLAVVGDVGALPNAALGGEMAASLDYRWVRLMALGTLIVGSHTDAQQKGADFELIAGSLLVCGRRPTGAGVAGLCVGAELGELRGTGAGVQNPRSGASLWWAPRVDAGLAASFADNWSIFGRLGATLPRVRRDFVVHDTLFVHRPDGVTGRLAVGVELELM